MLGGIIIPGVIVLMAATLLWALRMIVNPVSTLLVTGSVGVLLIVLSLGLILQTVLQKTAGWSVSLPGRAEMAKAMMSPDIIFLGTLCVYFVLYGIIGYYASAALFCFVVPFAIGYWVETRRQAVLFCVQNIILLSILYGIFTALLQVPF